METDELEALDSETDELELTEELEETEDGVFKDGTAVLTLEDGSGTWRADKWSWI